MQANAKLKADGKQLKSFCDLFKHADPAGFVSLRAFYDDEHGVFRICAIPMKHGIEKIVDTAIEIATAAANASRPVVFAPPLATFNNSEHAREQDLLQSLVLSVECDLHPRKARAKLEKLLGKATVVVRSGGVFINDNDKAEDKLHLHWRWAQPPTGKDLAKAKQARVLAARIVGADPSGKPSVHPFRWPGSWHRKKNPRLCKIVAQNDREIDLDDAFAKLSAAAPAQTDRSPKEKDSSASGLFYKQCCDFFERNSSVDEIEAAFTDNPKRYAKTSAQRYQQEDRLRDQIERCRKSWEVDRAARGGVVAEINKTYALVVIGDKTMILREGEKSISFLQVSAFRQWFSNRHVQIGGQDMPMAKYWLKHPQRRQFEGIVFAPGDQPARPGYFNLWRGFAVKPKKGDCSKFLAHLRDNVCCGSKKRFDWVVGWFAQMFQHPERKIGTSLALRGKQGVGKNIVGEVFGSLLGPPHYVPVAEPRYITGQFNSHLIACILFQCDEAFFAGDHSAAGKTKDLVTGDEHAIEFKGKEPIWVKNYVRLFVTGNAKWLVPAGLEERRFCVLDVSEEHMQDHAYFKAIKDEMDNGGREALLDYVLKFDLSKVDVRTIPQTGALLDQKIASLPPEEGWWLDILTRGWLPDAAEENGANASPRVDLFDDYVEHAGKQGARRRSIETALGRTLCKLAPGLRTSGRERLYFFPPLAECREKFIDLLQQHIAFDEPDEWTIPEDDEEGSNGHKSNSRKSDGDKVVVIKATVVHETEKAYRLNDGTKEVWVPKSEVEQYDDGTFGMPEWLRHKKGFAVATSH